MSFAGYISTASRTQPWWWCLCDCGTGKRIPAPSLTQRKAISCGCRRVEVCLERSTHGEGAGPQQTVEHRIWAALKNRCNNPNYKKYHRYGGRGISVCERWNDYSNFLEDMGRRPGKGYSIDRIDNDGNYEPGNCRWATIKQQINNSTVVKQITFNGQTRTLSEWDRVMGWHRGTVGYRLGRGWSIEEALTKPPRKSRQKKPTLEGDK